MFHTEQREKVLVADAALPFVFGDQSQKLVAFQVAVVEPAAAHSFQVHQQDARVEALGRYTKHTKGIPYKKDVLADVPNRLTLV